MYFVSNKYIGSIIGVNSNLNAFQWDKYFECDYFFPKLIYLYPCKFIQNVN